MQGRAECVSLRVLCPARSGVSFIIMTTLPQTPKKFCEPIHSSKPSSCRLCQSVGDISHWKNLFAKANRPILSAAEELCGRSLPRSDYMSHLVCRPCERRLNNFKAFKATICDSQDAYERRFKRCIEISPSAPRTLKSTKGAAGATVRTSRRGLPFDAPASSRGEKVCVQ